MFTKPKIAALVAEFLGTGILALLILSVQRSTIGVPFFIALAAGLTFATLTFAFSRVSGAYFNPALTIAMAIARRIAPARAVLYIAAQLLGGWAAYYLYTYYTKNSFQPIGGVYNSHILVAEAVAAGIFALVWASARYQNFSTAVRSSVSGLAYMVGMLAASSAAIGLLNPAVSLSARAWVWGTYVLGPILGAVIGVNLYGLLFAKNEDNDVVAVAATKTVTPRATVVKKTTVTKKPAARKTAAKRKPAAKKR